MKYNTIDLDLNPRLPDNDKYLLKRIIEKIVLCDSCLEIEYKDSNSKGYHIIFSCSRNCDLCRFVFDDAKRFMLDLRRPEWRQNILFDIKGVKA